MLFVVVYGIIDLTRYAERPGVRHNADTIVIIRAGQGFGDITKGLIRAGVVSDRFRFRLLARLKGYDRRVKAGEYMLSPSMPPLEILKKLASGKTFQRRLTIPEGYTLRQIASVITNNKGDGGAFFNLATDAEFVHSLGINAPTAEGYLFPDTYHFSAEIKPDQIIMIMVKQFRTVFTKKWESRAKQLGMSVHEVVTLASIIEKETGQAAERPLIASVFHNRLRRKMRLQSDPTVIYGIPDFDGNLTRKHLNTLTPYNTYQITGLPPGPIANPGKDSLHAALWPESTGYLYFVSMGNKTHKFSKSLKEHNAAVRKYQLSK